MRPPTWKFFWLAGGAKGGRMGIIRKYAFVLALALAVIYAYAPLSSKTSSSLDGLMTSTLSPTSPSHPQSRKCEFPELTQSPQRRAFCIWLYPYPRS